MKYYYCYSIKRGLFDREMQYAKDLGVYIFYDEEEDEFFDQDNNLIEIRNMPIFPRAGVRGAKYLVDVIITHGGKCLVKKEDYDITLNWPYYVKTVRNNIILSGRQILDNPELIISRFGNERVFFKTKQKNYSQIIDISKFLKKDLSFTQALEAHENDDFIISDAVEIENDGHGMLEYRAFIVNSEIYNISRISELLLSSIPNEVISKLKEIVHILKETDFPKSYVIDLFIYKDKNGKRVVDVLECNPIVASGTYLYNSVFEKIDDLEHKCPSASLPKEKIKYGKKEHSNYNFDTIDNTIPSIFYNLPGGFAADLTSYALFGTKSSNYPFFHFCGTNTSNLTIPKMDFELIPTDDELVEPKKLSRIKED